MTVPVPDPRTELIEAAARHVGTPDGSAICTCGEWHEERDEWIKHFLTHILPLLTPADVPHIERQVRERLADELVEWCRSGVFLPYGDDEGEVLDAAAKIKRGETLTPWVSS